MEVLTLRYYLSLFSILLIILIFFLYNLNFNIGFDNDEIIHINKGQSIKEISHNINKKNNSLKGKIYYYILKISNKFYSPINYGKFKIKKNSTLIFFIKTISTKSNLDYKITIVEGWEHFQLSEYLKVFYNDKIKIPYGHILADTYIINSSNTINQFIDFLITNKNNFFITNKKNYLFNYFSEKDLMIIASLVEKEGSTEKDKKLIASVIFNRLKLKMKLQRDATVIFALTDGEYRYNKNITYTDLKINHPYNTYFINGLPPGMISYVSPKTLQIVLENPKSDFLFYFYNIFKKEHIFSKNYKEHIRKLNDYRKQTK